MLMVWSTGMMSGGTTMDGCGHRVGHLLGEAVGRGGASKMRWLMRPVVDRERGAEVGWRHRQDVESRTLADG
jgi:hypothetical protein